MAHLVDCWCDKPSPGGLTREPCTRKATQEDMLCDTCREKCSTVYIGPAGGKATTLLATHAKVEMR
jgi:hypothetical protein